LAIDVALDFALGPSIVDVDNGQHVPATRLKLVLDAVLETLPFDFGRRQDEATSNKVSRIAQAFTGPETVKVRFLSLYVHGIDRI
jgi:hypothetical protein